MKTISIIVPIFVAVFLSGCGGGGGGSSPSTTNPANTYSISGTVTGAASVPVSLTSAATATTTTDAGGSYSFPGLANGSYTVKPAKAGYVFSPISLAAIMSGANITGKNFTATASTVVTYSISGTVSGAVVQGVTITLSGANTGSVVTDANGNYSFSGLVSGSYTVTPSLAGYAFTTSSTIVIGSVNPPSNNFTSTVTPSGSKVVFVPLNPLPPAMVGAAYSNTVISTPTSGGTAPYHYQSDSFATGAPPMGMIVDLNGNLTGTPSVTGTYTFGVCAVDLVGAQSCKTTSIVVNPASVTGTTPIITFDSLVIAQRETRTYDGGMFTGIVTEERYRLTGTATANGPIHTYLYTYPGNSGTLVMNGWTGIDIANNHFRAPGDPASTTFTFNVYTDWVSVSTGTLPLTVSVEADFWDPDPYLWSKASKTIAFS